MKYKRSDRVGDLIREEVASLIMYGGIKDPRIGFVTITRVQMPPDLKFARIYFSQIGSEADKQKSMEGLASACGFVRRHLAKALSLRHIPEIQFEYDDSLEYADHIERVIKESKGNG
ncbi:MAG: 30S ribosome-binding factor RbfA [Deltaproteobacteria bacterium]